MKRSSVSIQMPTVYLSWPRVAPDSKSKQCSAQMPTRPSSGQHGVRLGEQLDPVPLVEQQRERAAAVDVEAAVHVQPGLQDLAPLAVEEEEHAALLPAHDQVAVLVDRVLETELVQQLLDQRQRRQHHRAAVGFASPVQRLGPALGARTSAEHASTLPRSVGARHGPGGERSGVPTPHPPRAVGSAPPAIGDHERAAAIGTLHGRRLDTAHAGRVRCHRRTSTIRSSTSQPWTT